MTTAFLQYKCKHDTQEGEDSKLGPFSRKRIIRVQLAPASAVGSLSSWGSPLSGVGAGVAEPPVRCL